NRLDIRRPENRPKLRHVVVQIAFLDEGVRPDCLDQLISGYGSTRICNQEKQGIEDLWSNGHRLALATHRPPPLIPPQIPELVDRSRPCTYDFLTNILPAGVIRHRPLITPASQCGATMPCSAGRSASCRIGGRP